MSKDILPNFAYHKTRGGVINGNEFKGAALVIGTTGVILGIGEASEAVRYDTSTEEVRISLTADNTSVVIDQWSSCGDKGNGRGRIIARRRDREIIGLRPEEQTSMNFPCDEDPEGFRIK